jgi:Lectin C-type domain
MSLGLKGRSVPVCLLVVGGVLGSCAEEADDLGGLMLAVSSDGPLPINRLEITVLSKGATLRSSSYRVPQEATLPTTLAIATNGDPTASVEITVVGWNGTLPLDRRDAIVQQVPTDRVAMLPVVLSGRCSSKVMAVDGEAVSSCEGGSTCDPQTGDCDSATIDAARLSTYTSGAEATIGSGGGSGTGAGGSGGSGSGGDGAGGSAGATSEGGMPGSGGAGGEEGGLGGQPDPTSGGSAGSAGTGGSAGDAGSGGGNGGNGGSTAGTSGSGGNGGSGGMCETEICDGLDNDCDDTPDQGTTCPPNCVGQTYNAHTYVFCGVYMTWVNAQGACIGMGLDLLTVDTDQENAYVADYVTTHSMLPVWIGANDRNLEQDWRWPNGDQFWQGDGSGVPVGGRYYDWDLNQPDNLPNGVADCGTMTSTGWRDADCSAASLFVCRDP